MVGGADIFARVQLLTSGVQSGINKIAQQVAGGNRTITKSNTESAQSYAKLEASARKAGISAQQLGSASSHANALGASVNGATSRMNMLHTATQKVQGVLSKFGGMAGMLGGVVGIYTLSNLTSTALEADKSWRQFFNNQHINLAKSTELVASQKEQVMALGDKYGFKWKEEILPTMNAFIARGSDFQKAQSETELAMMMNIGTGKSMESITSWMSGAESGGRGLAMIEKATGLSKEQLTSDGKHLDLEKAKSAVAEKYADTLDAQGKSDEANIVRMDNAINKIKVSLGNMLAGPLGAIASKISGVASWFDKLDKGTQSLIGAVALVGIGFVALAPFLAPALSIIKDMVGGMGTVGSKLKDFLLPSTKKVNIDCGKPCPTTTTPIPGKNSKTGGQSYLPGWAPLGTGGIVESLVSGIARGGLALGAVSMVPQTPAFHKLQEQNAGSPYGQSINYGGNAGFNLPKPGFALDYGLKTLFPDGTPNNLNLGDMGNTNFSFGKSLSGFFGKKNSEALTGAQPISDWIKGAGGNALSWLTGDLKPGPAPVSAVDGKPKPGIKEDLFGKNGALDFSRFIPKFTWPKFNGGDILNSVKSKITGFLHLPSNFSFSTVFNYVKGKVLGFLHLPSNFNFNTVFNYVKGKILGFLGLPGSFSVNHIINLVKNKLWGYISLPGGLSWGMIKAWIMEKVYGTLSLASGPGGLQSAIHIANVAKSTASNAINTVSSWIPSWLNPFHGPGNEAVDYLGSHLQYIPYGGHQIDPMQALATGGNCVDLSLGLIGAAGTGDLVFGKWSDGNPHAWAKINGKEYDPARKAIYNRWSPPPQGPGDNNQGLHLHFHGDVYGFDDFEDTVMNITGKGLRRTRLRNGC